jgi:hypothetical protein
MRPDADCGVRRNVLLLVLRAYFELIYIDLYLMRGDFAALYSKVRNIAVSRVSVSDERTRQICQAVDTACIWYWKEVLCLQRSAVTARLLKAHGISAQMLIGAQQMPFRAHAWVEVEGQVVNDKPYMREMYAVLERC